MSTDSIMPAGSAEAPQSIVVRTPNWLGDLMVATAFLASLLNRFPGVPVDLIVRRGFEGVPLPHRGRVILFDRAAVSAGTFGQTLRGQGHTHFFVLPPSFSSAWMAYRSGVPNRIGYGGGFRGGLLRPVQTRRAPPRSRHLCNEYLDLLAPWGGVPEQPPAPRLPLEPSWVDSHYPSAAAGLERYVVLAPGAEYGPAKQWPVASYRRLAARLLDAGWPVVVAGLAADESAGQEILNGATRGLNLCGQTGIVQLIALLARAALLVSNDSGAMHIGAALGIPQIAVFGSTNPTWTAPLNPRARVIYRALQCSPCYARICPLGHTDCLRGIEPDRVADDALALLDER